MDPTLQEQVSGMGELNCDQHFIHLSNECDSVGFSVWQRPFCSAALSSARWSKQENWNLVIGNLTATKMANKRFTWLLIGYSLRI